MSNTLSSTPATEVAPVALAQLFSAAYSKYAAGPVTLPETSFTKWCTDNFVSMAHSRVFSLGYTAVAIALIGTRGDLPHTSRLAAIGVVAEHQGKGLSKQVLQSVVKGADLGLELSAKCQSWCGESLQKASTKSMMASRNVLSGMLTLWSRNREQATSHGRLGHLLASHMLIEPLNWAMRTVSYQILTLTTETLSRCRR
jgi:GNAT superfamily N-acetyltransferase